MKGLMLVLSFRGHSVRCLLVEMNDWCLVLLRILVDPLSRLLVLQIDFIQTIIAFTGHPVHKVVGHDLMSLWALTR